MKRDTLESAGWYALAFFLTQVLHEIAHAVVGVLTGMQPTLHTSFVAYPGEADIHRIWSIAAGPLFSLVQGVLLLAVVRKGPKLGRARLMLTWLCFHGLVNFVGYVFTTSFAPGADLGKLAGLLEVPLWGRLAMTGLGLAGLRLLVRPLAPAFVGLADGALDEDAARAYSKRIGVLAGAVATPALVVAALPVPHWLSLVYVACAFLPLFDLPDAAARAHAASGRTPLAGARPGLSIGLWVIAVVVGRALLDRGLPLF